MINSKYTLDDYAYLIFFIGVLLAGLSILFVGLGYGFSSLIFMIGVIGVGYMFFASFIQYVGDSL